MDVLRSEQGAEIARVLRYEDEVPRYASGQNVVVRRTQSTEIARMCGAVNALGVQRFSDPRRQSLIEEQAHRLAASAAQAGLRHGLPDGRPRRGWALA